MLVKSKMWRWIIFPETRTDQTFLDDVTPSVSSRFLISIPVEPARFRMYPPWSGAWTTRTISPGLCLALYFPCISETFELVRIHPANLVSWQDNGAEALLVLAYEDADLTVVKLSEDMLCSNLTDEDWEVPVFFCPGWAAQPAELSRFQFLHLFFSRLTGIK